MNLWRTVRDLVRNDVPIRPHLCRCGRVTTRLSHKSYTAWLTGGFRLVCRCGGRTVPIPHPAFGDLPGTARLMNDLTQKAAADRTRDGHPSTNPSPREGDESMPTLTPAERTAFAETMSAAEIWFFVIFVKSDNPEAFDATAEQVRGMRAKDDQTMTAFEES